MKRFFRAAVAAMIPFCCGALQAQDYHISDSAEVVPVSLSLGGDCDGGSGCDSGCDGGKAGCDSGGCDGAGNGCGCGTCYLFGGDDAWELSTGDNCLGAKVGGWVQAGYHSDPTLLSRTRGDGLAFNDVPDDFNLHQMWLYIEKAVDPDSCHWDWGYRADIVYGTDAQKTQAFGGSGWDTSWDHGVYGWAMPQLYVEVARGPLSIKGGHFYTLVGYEVVPAPDNFFYSHSLTMFNSEPFTHSGVLATYTVSDDLEVYGGWTAGWDTGFETVSDGSSFLGGFSYALMDNVQFTYITTAGDFGLRGDRAYSHSLLFDVALTDRVNYVFQSDLLSIESTGEDDIGINQYLIYQYNDCVGLGARLEWWRDEGVSHNEVTGGINYRPHANVVIRPEVRLDWIPSTGFEETTFGIDAIFTF